MSKLNELKQMSPTLRAAMARRDSIRKHVNKHKSNAEHCQAQIISLNKKLEELTDTTIEKTAKFSADCELELDYAAKAGVLLKKAQTHVDTQIAELDAIRAKEAPKRTVAKAVEVDAKLGKAIRDAQQAGFDTPEQHEAAKLEEIKVAAAEAEVREADSLRKRIDDAKAELAKLEDKAPAASQVEEMPPKDDEHMAEEDVDAELAKELAEEGKPKDEKPAKIQPTVEDLEPEPKKEKDIPQDKGTPKVPVVEPAKDPAVNEPPVRGMSKRQRRKANRLARLEAQQGG